MKCAKIDITVLNIVQDLLRLISSNNTVRGIQTINYISYEARICSPGHVSQPSRSRRPSVLSILVPTPVTPHQL